MQINSSYLNLMQCGLKARVWISISELSIQLYDISFSQKFKNELIKLQIAQSTNENL